MMRRVIFFLCFCCFFFLGQAQSIKVHSESGPVEHAYVTLSDLEGRSFFKAITNQEGKVYLSESPLVEVILRIQHISFITQIDTLLLEKEQLAFLQEKTWQMEEVVVTGEYAEVAGREAVNRIQVISKERIKESASNDLADILSHQANIRLSQDGVIGTGISLQGLGDNAVKILVDGVPVIGRLNGQVDLGQFNVQDIERIEIVEGPMAVNYGTDALAGVINIITTGKKDSASFSLNAYAESIGQYDAQISGRGFLKKTGVEASFGRRFFDGWVNGDRPFHEPEPIADERRVDDWNQKEQYFAHLGLSRKMASWNLKYDLRGLDEALFNRGIPNISPITAIAFDDRYKTRRLDNSLKIDADLKAGRTLNQIIAYNIFSWNKRRVVRDLTNLSDQMTADGQDSTTYDAWRLRGTFSNEVPDKHRLSYQVGYDGGYESASGGRILNAPSMFEMAGFGSLRYMPLEGLVLSPGLRATYNDSYRSELTPSLSARYQKDKTTFRLSYGRGFRAPSFKELHLQFVDINHFIIGNPNLKAETSDSYNVSMDRLTSTRDLSVKLGLSAYLNQVQNGIELVQSGINTGGSTALPFTYVNFRKLSTYGLRSDIQLRQEKRSLTLGLGVAAKDYGAADEETPLTPQVNVRVDQKIGKKGLHVSTSYTYQGLTSLAIIEEEESTRLIEQEAYSLWDLTLSCNFLKDRMKLSIGARNLMDVTAVALSEPGGFHNGTESSSFIGTGRTYFMNVNWTWKK